MERMRQVGWLVIAGVGGLVAVVAGIPAVLLTWGADPRVELPGGLQFIMFAIAAGAAVGTKHAWERFREGPAYRCPGCEGVWTDTERLADHRRRVRH